MVTTLLNQPTRQSNRLSGLFCLPFSAPFQPLLNQVEPGIAASRISPDSAPFAASKSKRKSGRISHRFEIKAITFSPAHRSWLLPFPVGRSLS